MADRQEDDIDLERAATDPDYRRKVLPRLKAEAEGGPATADDDAPPMTRRRGPTIKPHRR